MRYILFLGGGGMSGVFGAGVVTGLQEIQAYEHIDAIYGSSCGTFNGAYFLAGQSRLGSGIYTDELKSHFVHPNVLLSTFLRELFGFRIRKRHKQILDIDYLMKVAQHIRQLDIEIISHHRIPLFASLMNLDTLRAEHVQVTKSNAWRVLKAAVNVCPYYDQEENINGTSYIDGALAEPIPLTYLLEKYPKHRIVVILNIPKYRPRILDLIHFTEGLIASRLHNIKMLSIFRSRETKIRAMIREGLKNPRVTMVFPPHNNPTRVWTTNRDSLMKTFAMGQEIGRLLIS